MSPAAKRASWMALIAASALVAALAPPTTDEGLALSPRSQQVGAKLDAGAQMPPTPGLATPPTAAGPFSRNQAAARADRTDEPSVLSIKPRTDDRVDDHEPPLFSATQWSTAPAPAAVLNLPPAQSTVPAVAPQAPALPFRIIGRYDDGTATAVFLQQNDRNLVVHVGDVVDTVYRVERLDGGTLTLRYLPLNQLQSIEIGGAS